MKTKRKLVPKSTVVSSSAATGERNVIGQDGGANVCGGNPSVPFKRPCIRQSSSTLCLGQQSHVRLSVSSSGQRVGQLKRNVIHEGLSTAEVRLTVSGQLLSQSAHGDNVNTYSVASGEHHNHTDQVVDTDAFPNRFPATRPPPEYKHLGSCTHSCQHCGALFWYEERLKSIARGLRPRYNRCCKGGRVALRTYQIYPEYMKLLLEDRHFLENIRVYNQMFSMTSLGAQIDESINNGRGPYIDNRMSHFGGDNSGLRKCIIEGLIDLLDAHNALVQLFRTAREKFEDMHIPNFKVQLYNVVGAREYELPTGDMLGAIVYETGPETDMDYDIILEGRSGYPQRVNKLHPSYMSLQFPLLFIYAQDGYSKELKMIDATRSSSEQKQLTMLAYYSY
ncbi:hypothetical protein Tco_0987937 [Tanacetum coccineum]